MFLPNSIKDIILYYLNPHELYIDELKDKTREVYNGLINTHSIIDYGYGGTLMITRFWNSWRITESLFVVPKNGKTHELNKRVNQRNKILGIIESNKHGMKNGFELATNFCYINY